jgi:hypothetical protein
MSEKRYRLRVPARDRVIEGIVRRLVDGRVVAEFVPIHFYGAKDLGVPAWMDIDHALRDRTLVEVVAAVAQAPAAVVAAVPPVVEAVAEAVVAVVDAVAEAAPVLTEMAAAVGVAAAEIKYPLPDVAPAVARAVRVGRRGGRS